MLTWFVAAALAAGPVFALRDGDVAVPVTAHALPSAVSVQALTACDVQWRLAPEAEPVRTITGCEGPWREAVDQASAAWVLTPPAAAFRDGDAVRHATFYAWPDGKVRVALWGTRLSDQAPLPDGLVYGRQPDPVKKFPLEVPEELKARADEIDCRVRLSVDAKGKPRAADGAECDEAWRDQATKVAAGWRFSPAMIEEAPVPAPFFVTARWSKPAPPPPPRVFVPDDGKVKLPEGVAFRLHHNAGDRVDVLEYAVPAPVSGAVQHCSAAFRISRASTTSMIEGCAGPFLAAAESAAAKWKFGPPALTPEQEFTTFRVSFYSFPEGHVRVALWDTFPGDRLDVLPDGFVYGEPPGVGTFVPPKYPDLGAERITVHCFFAIALDERGGVVGITPELCDEPWLTPGLEALKKWDFKPAKVDGVKVPYTWRVDVKFDPQPIF